ncbi:membrane protein insertase YidC [Planococcus sp. SIMBA_160]
MKKKLTLLLMLAATIAFLSGCSAVENKEGFFYSIFVAPFDFSLDYLGNLFGGSYGMAIVVITIIIRLVLMPFMLRTYKRQQGMKVKMDKMRPEMEDIQKRLKETKDKEEQMKLQQEMMGLYKKHDVNPLNMGCLPVVIQMPIIMGLYFAILYSPDVRSHEFLWFNLGSPDIAMTLIAGAVYFFQAKVSLWTMPEQQQKQMKFFIYLSPIMIMFISFTSMAALPVYWAVGGILLIIQTFIGRKFYSQHPEKALESVEETDAAETTEEKK